MREPKHRQMIKARLKSGKEVVGRYYRHSVDDGTPLLEVRGGSYPNVRLKSWEPEDDPFKPTIWTIVGCWFWRNLYWLGLYDKITGKFFPNKGES